jgi:DNA-binding response OmpR family regulator
LSNILKNRDFQSSCVNTIGEARKLLAREIPYVIFLDNHLPDGFGIDFIEEVKRLAPVSRIIMITAYDTKTDKEKAILKGVDYFIGKPFTRENIFEAIENIVNLRDVEL